jgi:hypothetical protein
MDLLINNINYSNLPDNIKLDIKNLTIYHNQTIKNINQNISNNQISIVYNQLLESLEYYDKIKKSLENINYNDLTNKEYRYSVNNIIDKEYIIFINNILNKYLFELDKIFIDNFMLHSLSIKK